MRKLVVGGTFDDYGRAKGSGIVDKLTDLLKWDGINGGLIANLEEIEFEKYGAVLWMPQVSNDVPKILPSIKKLNPTLLLISTKNIVGRSFDEWDFIGRLLKSHSNLGLMIDRNPITKIYSFKLMDPLGNVYCSTTDLALVANAINTRVDQITEWTRLRSKCVGFAHVFDLDPEFLDVVRKSAEEFTKHVNAANPNRFLGNASTRCMYGFPSERRKERIFVTKRNIDKQYIESNNFVEVTESEDRVEYFGEHKPSVDTPIQIKLFNYYKNIRFMIHGHVYVEGVSYTDHRIPCGVVEEFDDIIKVFPDPDTVEFAINLKGHGCIICTSTVDGFKNYKYTSRPFPEYAVDDEYIKSIFIQGNPKSAPGRIYGQ